MALYDEDDGLTPEERVSMVAEILLRGALRAIEKQRQKAANNKLGKVL